MDDYDDTTGYWGQHCVDVYSTTGRSLALIPTGFLVESKTNSWDYVIDVVERTTGVSFESPPAIHDDAAGVLVNQEDAPHSGTFTLVPSNQMTPTTPLIAQRHESVRSVPRRPMSAAGSAASGTSSRSTSSLGSDNSTRFRLRVLLRSQGQCLVTRRTRLVEAAHLAPKALGTQRLTAIAKDRILSVFNLKLGILLDRHLHGEYDQRRFAFFPLRGGQTGDDGDEEWVCHYFHPPITAEGGSDAIGASIDEAYRACHGKIIKVSGSMMTRPSWRFASWHYTECVRARFFGVDREPLSVNQQGPLEETSRPAFTDRL